MQNKPWNRQSGLWERRSMSVWEAQAEKFRTVAHQLKDSLRVEDMLARVTMLRLAEDYEKAASGERNKKITRAPGR